MMNEYGARDAYQEPDLHITTHVTTDGKVVVDAQQLAEAKELAGVAEAKEPDESSVEGGNNVYISAGDQVKNRAKKAAFLTGDNTLYKNLRDEEDETVRQGSNGINHPAYKILQELFGMNVLKPGLTKEHYENARQMTPAEYKRALEMAGVISEVRSAEIAIMVGNERNDPQLVAVFEELRNERLMSQASSN